MKHKKLGSAVLLGLLVTVPVFAEEGSMMVGPSMRSETSVNGEKKPGERKMMINRDREEYRDKIKEDRTELKDELESDNNKIKDVRGKNKEEAKLMRESYEKSSAEEKAQIKASIEVKKAAYKAEIKNTKKEKLSTRKEFAAKRFNNAIVIIESKQARVTTILEKMKANGKDTTSAEASLKVSIDTLAVAKTSLASFVSLSSAAEKDTVALKASAQKVENDLKASRDALIKALHMVENDAKATTEVKNTTSVNTSTNQ